MEITLLGTNISHSMEVGNMSFLSHWWDMIVLWRVKRTSEINTCVMKDLVGEVKERDKHANSMCRRHCAKHAAETAPPLTATFSPKAVPEHITTTPWRHQILLPAAVVAP